LQKNFHEIFPTVRAKAKKQAISFDDDLDLDSTSFLDGQLQHNCALSTFTNCRGCIQYWKHKL